MSPLGKGATRPLFHTRATATEFRSSLQYYSPLHYLVSYKLLGSKTLTSPLQLTQAFNRHMLAVNWRVGFTYVSPQTSKEKKKASPKISIMESTIQKYGEPFPQL